MSEGPAKKDGGFAPIDYTDGRGKGEWKSRYEPAARTAIRYETAYLVIITAIYLFVVFYVLKEASLSGTASTSDSKPIAHSTGDGRFFLCALGALSAGALGGCCFGIKWMYHSVAKQLWNEDRRLWRVLSPHVSGTYEFESPHSA